MELDDLRDAWAAAEGKLEATLRINERLRARAGLERAASSLSRLSRLLWLELAVNLIAALWLGSFLAANVWEARFFLPAAVLDLCVVALLVASVRQLAAIRSIDYAGPVVAIQERLAALRAERVRATLLTLVAAPLLWTPLLIVSLKGFFGVDTYATFSSAWLVANALFGLAVIAIAIFVSRRYGDRLQGSPRLQALTSLLAGRSLSEATDFVRSVATFAAEPVSR